MTHPERICRSCGQPVIRNGEHFEVLEGMHWLRFHLELEHDQVDRVPELRPRLRPGRLLAIFPHPLE